MANRNVSLMQKTVVQLHSSPKTIPWIMRDQKLFKMLNFCVFVLMSVFCNSTLFFHECLNFVINFVIYVGLCKGGWIVTSCLLGPARRALFDDAG